MVRLLFQAFCNYKYTIKYSMHYFCLQSILNSTSITDIKLNTIKIEILIQSNAALKLALIAFATYVVGMK